MKKTWKLLMILLVLVLVNLDCNYVEAATIESRTRYKIYDEGLEEYLYTYEFVVDGHTAFCIQRSKNAPTLKATVSDWIPVDNDSIRKVLYYGYKGPQDKGYGMAETALAAGSANGDGSPHGDMVLAEIEKYPVPPEEFLVWKVETNGGESQDLAFYAELPDGYIEVNKASTDGTLSYGNGAYTLNKAFYGVYSDAACTTLLHELKTNTSGMTGSVSVPPGTYYVKEISAPRGYLLNPEVQKVEVFTKETSVVKTTDIPRTIIPELIVQKMDAETGTNTAQGMSTLANARFAVKFYFYSLYDGTDPALLGAQPMRQWIMKTDANGQIYMSDEYKVSGDALWKNDNGEVVLPLGTITIQEILPPDGYCLNTEVYVRDIKIGDESFETVEVADKVLQVKLQKVNDIGEKLSGVGFTVYSDEACTQEVTEGETDEEGKLIFTGLKVQTKYYIKETKAPEGHQMTDAVYEIYSDGTEEQSEIVQTIINKRNYKLPETGSREMLFIELLGTGCLVLSTKKKRRLSNEK